MRLNVSSLCHFIGASLLCCGLLQASDAPTPYRTTWVGNTFGGGANTWVQGHVQDMWVAPSGAVFTTSWWDEGGNEQSVYRAGRLIAHIGPPGHKGGGWTVAITGHENAIYAGFGTGDKVSIRQFDATALPLQPAAAGQPPFVLPQTASCALPARQAIWGMACTPTHLFAAVPEEDRVHILDLAGNLKVVGGFAAKRPMKIAVAGDGTLWIVQGFNGMGGTSIGHFTAEGTRLPETITDVEEVRALAWSATRKQLLVGENGKENCLIAFDVKAAPKRVSTFGRPYAAGGAGSIAPDKFDGITGVGTDRDNNLYVVGDGRLSGETAGDGNGTVLRSFNAAAKLNWELLGIEFVDSADVDPASDGLDVYSDFNRYRLDPKAAAGTDWTWQGKTFDRFRANDYRNVTKHGYVLAMRRIQGKLFMYTTGQWPHWMSIFRMEGNQAIPCGRWIGLHEPKKLWAQFPGAAIPEELKGQRIGSFWTDANGDGLIQPDEAIATDPTWCWGRSVDETGGVWHVHKTRILNFTCGGLNQADAPIYDYAKRISYPLAPGLTEMTTCSYRKATDTMLIIGWTTAVPRKDREDRAVGRVLACYRNWSTPERAVVWSVPLAESDGGVLPADYIAGLAIAGDYAFAGFTNKKRGGGVGAFSLKDGHHAQTFVTGPEVGLNTGWLDIPNPIHAFERKNGEIMILAEEDAFHKVVIYHWRP